MSTTLIGPPSTKAMSGKKADKTFELKGRTKQKVAFDFAPGPKYEARLQAVQQTIARERNPFLEAGSFLLRTLAEMPKVLTEEAVDGLHTLLRQEVNEFIHLCTQANLPHNQSIAVSYILCAALDEMVSLRPMAGGGATATGPWSMKTLLSEFHSDADAGDTVFLLVGRLANSPEEHMDVLEVAYHVVSLGYMGRYRQQAGGPQTLDVIRQRLFAMLSASRPPVPRELSPQRHLVTRGKFRHMLSVPVWVSASVLGLVLFGQWTWYRYSLAQEQAAVTKAIEELANVQATPGAVTGTGAVEATGQGPAVPK